MNGYLQNWIAAANAQVSQHQLRIVTAPNPDATASDPCGWRIEAALSQLTPGGNPAVLILEVFLTGTTLQIRPGIGNTAPYVEADTEQGWVYPAGDVSNTSAWSTTPLPFNAQVGWSLTPGAEYFVFAYSQHRFTNRQAVPLLIARDQVSGHWILAASPIQLQPWKSSRRKWHQKHLLAKQKQLANLYSPRSGNNEPITQKTLFA